MTGAQVLSELVVVLGTAAITTLLFQALRLPAVLGYVAAGLLIGPHVPVPFVANAGLVHVLSELGVIMLMFSIGLELRISTLAKVGVGAGLTALFEVALVLTTGALVARALGFSATESIFAGACLAISSTMLVAKAFEQLGLKSGRGGITDVVFAILVFEDLIAIILLAVLTGLASGAGLEPRELVVTLGRLAGLLAGILLVCLLIIPRLVRHLARKGQHETVLIVGLALCFGLAIVTEHYGYPVALGAFVAGLTVAESGRGHEIGEQVKPFRDVFAMMFFVSIGMTIEPNQLLGEIPTILVFTVIVMVVKPVGVALGTFAAGRGTHPAIRAGVSLSQIGELSFVIAGIGASSGVVRPSLLAIAVGVTCLTTLSSSLAIRRSESIAHAIASRMPARIGTFVSFYEGWLDRLRSREKTAWSRVKRPVIVLALDVAALISIIIGGSLLGPWLAARAELTGAVAKGVVVAVVIAACSPFALGAVRRVVQIARILALVVIPETPDPVVDGGLPVGATAVAPEAQMDLGRAPRRALTLMLELALAAVVAFPVIATVQPFAGTAGLVIGVVVIALLAITYRSIVDFTQHVRAGSELILELLQSNPSGEQAAPIGPQLENVLPGFGGLVSVTLESTSPAVGRSLAELDLRARTGATVLAIGRGGSGGFATPTPTEPLVAGDVLALTGSDEALVAAKALLAS